LTLDAMEPLIGASIKGDLVAVRSLLRAGADVHARGPTYQTTALYQAAIKGFIAVVHELVKAGARLEDKDINGVQPSPLHPKKATST